MKQQHIEKHRMLGLKIAYYRKLKGLTQEQLAEKINKSLAFIGAVEAPTYPEQYRLIPCLILPKPSKPLCISF